ncbi:fimbrial protein [Serratia fonticola]|uniref:fimbrial protein n=1 Tax=Serratia fonticola TaxID=47917 RepID=UPI0015772318|nr:fimbrial protein [Serratia fonticola]NTY86570.1 type 1 fimbrial protein [Serratia fonticola]NTZ12455.1 type 1 fimbrial protein [Serratia fonticola]CAI1999561.1 Type-1A pilin [Serratia fonticola]CAI2142347.1 Type-1A pilin [Serratia fonticola]
MKKNIIAATLAAAALTSVSAVAADGQVKFTGEIIDAACTVTNSPANPLSVVMGKVAKSAFAQSGDKAAATKFTLKLTDCPGTVSSATVKFDGTSVNGDNSILALTQDAGTATGVGIQLSDDSNTVLPLFTASKSYALQSGSVINNLDFVARYISTAASVTPGPANATANFSINYN